MPLFIENLYVMHNIPGFTSILKADPPLGIDEEYVLYDVESSYTNISLKETIDHILAEICDHHKLKPMCSKLSFQ